MRLHPNKWSYVFAHHTTHPDKVMQHKICITSIVASCTNSAHVLQVNMKVFKTQSIAFSHVYIAQPFTFRSYFPWACAETNGHMCWHTLQHIQTRLSSIKYTSRLSSPAAHTVCMCCKYTCFVPHSKHGFCHVHIIQPLTLTSYIFGAAPKRMAICISTMHNASGPNYAA